MELLRYVPEDAFVARFRGTVVEEIQALPFVQWVGSYRPDHKLHDSLQAPAQAGHVLEGTRITLLLAPDATPAEIAAARTGLEAVDQESLYRFGSVLRGLLAPGQLNRLAESPAVLWIEPAPDMKLNDELSSKIIGGTGPNHATVTQEMGFDGRGRPELMPPVPAIRIAVADTGLSGGTSSGVHPDLAGRVTNFFHYGGLSSAADEHSHGTHVAGIVAGSGSLNTGDDFGAFYGLGVAPAAEIIAQRIFDQNGKYAPPPSFETLTSDAVSVGADIGNNSWGADTQGRYDVSAAEFDALVRDANTNAPGDQPYSLVFSAGNAGPGPQTVASPAVAKNVIAVGASQSSRGNFLTHMDGPEAIAAFSSRGPTEDGRIKPDLVAPGTWIASLRSSVGNRSNAWLVIDDDYLYMGGSSQAAAHVSGAAAAFVQYYRETFGFSAPCPSPALIKAALIQSAGNLNPAASVEPVPNSIEGWGRADLTRIIGAPREPVFVDQGAGLTNGQHLDRGAIVAGAAAPLKITMAYTDVPGFPAAIPALVNDLDLEVRAPDGRIYRGNQFNRGESVPNALSADNLNNVEGIYIAAPLPGEYVVRVVARNVAIDALKGTSAIDQDYALVISGDLASGESGAVLLDRSHYTAPGRMIIRLFDNDLSGYDMTPVTVYSGSEPGGKELLLSAATSSGMFTGAIATVQAPAPPGNYLRITNGDLIRVDYFDESVASNNFATAVCDLLPPIISSVAVTNRFGRTVVLWTTDEPANSVVRFGTDAILSRAVTNSLLGTTHELALPPLVNGLVYSFSITSTDPAGNSATNGPVGPEFAFLAQSPPTVLLVDAYNEEPGEPLIPLSTYTTPLEQLGVSYEVWSLASQGSLPLFQNLQPYPIVMWRVNDSVFRLNDSIPAAQQAALQQYLNLGGSFFMASMDILSRLMDQGSTSFMTNVLHVGRFQRNSNSLRDTRCTDCGEDAGVGVARGIANDLIGDGIMLSNLDYSAYDDPFGTFDSNFADTFGAATNASPFLVESVSGEPCGVRFPRSGEDSVGRVVFVSFPLDAISEIDAAPNNRAAFLRRALQFLSPGLNGVGGITFDRTTYKVPDLLTIEIADSDLAGTPSVTGQVFSTAAESPIDVTLRETTRPGVFRGFIPLVAATNPPAGGQLRATNGSTLFANYFDESGQAIVQAAATVDSTPAGISNISVAASFQSARISWTTSEPTDALVQFGESAFLGRTAYLRDLRTDHEIQLTGLFPGRTYFFKLVSRDVAGNSTTDDNGGQFHTFQTRAPLSAPFVDLLQNTVGSNWSVINGDGTQTQWQLTSIFNGHVFGSFGWASVPLGSRARSIDTVLLSPAIDLVGGNVATLVFSNSYSFNKLVGSDRVNEGQLFIVTNSVSAPLLLAKYTGATPTAAVWQREQIDLTPYIGQVIVLAWRHHLDSIEMDERPGWAIDDISITTSNVAPGTIEVANNLAQATVTLTGPATRTGRGYATNFSDLPPGRYVATWSDVPYYQIPPRQTNWLASEDLLLFTGQYTFPDTNANNMSDLWEMDFFGSVSPTRTCVTDTDHDGFPDCAEFIAGTNPNVANSSLRLLPPTPFMDGPYIKLRFQWPSVPGREYQLQALSRENFQTWAPQSWWIQATTGTTSWVISAPDEFEPYIFRIEVRP